MNENRVKVEDVLVSRDESDGRVFLLTDNVSLLKENGEWKKVPPLSPDELKDFFTAVEDPKEVSTFLKEALASISV
jgi:hypothetical protein